MPSSQRFILKDSPSVIKNLLPDPDQARGRVYSTTLGQQPGGVRIDEVHRGLTYACLAITDDEPGTLRKTARTNPWQLEAMKRLCRNDESLMHQPLSEILQTTCNLHLDHHIDEAGVTKGGHVVDTQGYVAHNDDTIVLAYRCTTTGSDWLTNLTTTSTGWEIDDIDQGHSGFCSAFTDGCCGLIKSEDYKPRVHTGFYNSFLVTAKSVIQEHIDPLLAPDQPARTLYVCGHSLGAGVATLAACYFLLEHDWVMSPHRLVIVTAGGPRAVCGSMQTIIDRKLAELRPLDKAVFCRVVRDKDGVVAVPPRLFGFRHVGKLVYLTKDGAILINPVVDDKKYIVKKRILKELKKDDPTLLEDHRNDDDDEDDEHEDEKEGGENDRETGDERGQVSEGKKLYHNAPRSLRDHMPEFYLDPVAKILGMERERIMKESKARDSSSDADTEAASDEGNAVPVPPPRRSLFGCCRDTSAVAVPTRS